MQLLSTAIALFLVFNAIGYIPVFLAVLSPFEEARQRKIIIRETLIAFAIIILFIFFGASILKALSITKAIIGIAGGILLLIISLNLIFPKSNESEEKKSLRQEPFIVPLAMPGLAGPGTIAAAMLYADQYGVFFTAAAFTIAWIPSFIALILASSLKKYLGDKGLHAIEKFGGMLIALIAVNMFSNGVVELVKDNFYKKQELNQKG